MDEKSICNSQFLLDVLEISRGRISQLEAEGLIKRAAKNEYYAAESIRNYIRFLRDKPANLPDGTGTDYNAERTRLTKIKADLAEFEKEQVSNKLIPSADVEQAWSMMVSNAKTRLLSIPVKVASALFAAQNNMNAIREIVEIQIIEALQELSNVQVRTVNPLRISDNGDDSDGGDKAVHASAEANGKQVGRPKSSPVSRVIGRSGTMAN